MPDSDEPQPLLEIKALNIHIQQKSVVQDLDLKISPGRIVGLVGESGSGKSITAMSILRLLPQTAHCQAERFCFAGQDLLALNTALLNQIRGGEIGTVFQEPMSSLNPVFTVGFQLSRILKTHSSLSRSERRDKVVELFAQVELDHPEQRFKAYPHELSGGQRQRVMLAMAMACEPQLLIADEPTSALDVVVQSQILDLIARLSEQNDMAVLFISHDLAAVSGIANEIAVMQSGRILESGKTSALLSQPKHAYTRELISDTQIEYMKPLQLTHDSQPLLSASDLQICFGRRSLLNRSKKRFVAVDQLKLEIHPGETLGLVGASGCGKTSLARAIARLIEPEKGQILFEGVDLIPMTQTALQPIRQRLQIIFQDPLAALNPRMTIERILHEPLQVHGLYSQSRQRSERVTELLQMVGLDTSLLQRYPHQLSGGQRQRVCIARALSLRPKLLICDEIMSSLDVSTRNAILDLLRTLQQEQGLAYLLISHDLSVVARLAHRIAVMDQGAIVETGPTQRVMSQPEHPVTRQLLAAVPDQALCKQRPQCES